MLTTLESVDGRRMRTPSIDGRRRDWTSASSYPPRRRRNLSGRGLGPASTLSHSVGEGWFHRLGANLASQHQAGRALAPPAATTQTGGSGVAQGRRSRTDQQATCGSRRAPPGSTDAHAVDAGPNGAVEERAARKIGAEPCSGQLLPGEGLLDPGKMN